MPSNTTPALTLFAAIIVFTALLVAAMVPVSTPGLSLEEGEVSSRTIRAPREISFVSDSLTDQRRDEAAEAVQNILTFDPGVAVAQQAQLNSALVRVRNVVADPALAPAAKVAALQRIEPLNLSQRSREVLSELPPEQIGVIDTETRRTLASVFDQSLATTQLGEVRERVGIYVDPTLNREMADLVAEIVRPFIVTNLTVDRARTDAAREAARAGVAPVQVAYAVNQIIVEEDAPITAEAREALVESGIIGTPWSLEVFGASALVGLAIAGAVGAGWRAFRPDGTPRQLVALALAIAIPVFVMKLYLAISLDDEQRHFFTYALPLSAATMVIAGFVGAELALLAAASIALLVAFAAVLLADVTVIGLAGSLDIIRLALVTGVAGAAGVFAVRNAERLGHFLIGGLVVGLSIVLTLGATWLIDPDREIRDLPWILAAAGANAGLSAFLSAGIFVTLGTLFGITTRLQLLEMSQLSQPLLMRLQDEAPSTFQHSVVVANLAEKGAHVIGADALLARVGCYYHDIGKLARPGFFIENQMGGPNPHDALEAIDSAQIITDHVRDGLALAKQYELPAKVTAFVPEHHGTRLALFFYRKAVEIDPQIDPDVFRYPGPKPQSRETAIAMLADSTEATVRSSPDHSSERIDAIVDEVFNERLVEGQLDESDLTLHNMHDLRESFKATLKAMYHPRIEYPAPTEAELFLRRLPFRGRAAGK